MKKIIVLFLLFFLGCGTARNNRKATEMINRIKTDRPFAERAINTAINAYPDLAKVDTVTVHDTIITPEKKDSIEYRPKYIVDTAATRKAVDSVLTGIDSLQILLQSRDGINQILNRTVNALLKKGTLFSSGDTLKRDTLGVSLKAWVSKGAIYAVIRQQSERIPYTQTVIKQNIQPADRPRWIDYYETWIACFVIGFLMLILVKSSSR